MAALLEYVTVENETTGLVAGDDVAVVGFEMELGCRVCYQTGGRAVDGVESESTVEDRTQTHVELSAHESEQAILEAVEAVVVVRLQERAVLLVGFNAAMWRGGFDLPLLGARDATHESTWPFRDVPYAELLPGVPGLFNTAVDGADSADLETTDDVLCGGAAGAGDPFDESVDAVAAVEADRVAGAVLHTAADIRRTGALSWCANRDCRKADVSLQEVTATVAD